MIQPKRDHYSIELRDGIAIVEIEERRILDEGIIQEMGAILFELTERQGVRAVLLDWSKVTFVSSAFFGKLITFDKKMKATRRKHVFTAVCTEIYESFLLTHLYRMFEFKETKEEGLEFLRQPQLT
ncbi:STAS domain-containing protein [Candidatus Peregrinibacteria bacterium]|nr:STAS domain-containing protein [Candidatus Peregrinibacteria bacterium]